MRIRPNFGPRTGGTAVAGLLWVFALLLFFVPFLRDPAAADSEEGDFSRAEDDIPYAEDVAVFEEEFELPLGELIADASENWYGPDSQLLRESGVIDVARLPGGERLYGLYCVGCHGSIGDGAGAAARHLSPRPRNFRKGLFKFKSTGSGLRPRRADLFQTLMRGLAGSSMPDFRLLDADFRWDLVEYVRYLGARGEFEQMMLDAAWEEEELPDPDEFAEIVNRRWLPENLRTVFPGAPETERDTASIERGRELFNDAARASCNTCHGPEGRGDGLTANDYNDDWGYPIRPRDLTLGVFRAGSEGSDLYRTIAVGITGTPMGSFEGALTPEEIWDMVHFVQSLPETR
jgi:mono/diheme cytochrome c family protein